MRLERHLAHCEAQREVNSWWWAFVGATSDAAAVPLGAVRRRPWLGVLLVAIAVAYVAAGWVGSAAEVAGGGGGARRRRMRRRRRTTRRSSRQFLTG